jgi:HAE1 family hydrophobic/amphiphilic exporter-1
VGKHQAFTIEATGQLMRASQFRPLIVAYRNGNPVRLEEIANVIDSVQDDKTANWYNADRAIGMSILRQPGTNTVEITDKIRNLMLDFKAQMPASVELNILYDRSVTIRDSIRDVKVTLMIRVLLMILVIFFFLRNLSATLIPSLAVPMSLIGSLAVMYLLNYTVDNLSLMALTLSVGFVVDDAIVMLENIVRHREMGKDAMLAAKEGSAEIGFTILSMTVSRAAVFIPVLFMGGIIGRLLHEFAVCISAAILISGFVSLTLTPMLCSRFLAHKERHQHGKLFQFSERFFDSLLAVYDWGLKKVLKHRLAIVFVSLLVLVATGYLFVVIPKGFLPTEDTGQLFGFTEGAQDTSYEAMYRHQQEMAAVIYKNPNIEMAMAMIGGNSANNAGRVFATLKPSSERKLTAEQVVQELRPQLARIPGISVYLQVPATIRIDGQLTKSLYQYT